MAAPFLKNIWYTAAWSAEIAAGFITGHDLVVDDGAIPTDGS